MRMILMPSCCLLVLVAAAAIADAKPAPLATLARADVSERKVGSVPAVEGGLVTSKDGRHFAFVISSPDSSYAVLDGSRFPSVGPSTGVGISPDGALIVYSWKQDGRQAIRWAPDATAVHDGVVARLTAWSPSGHRFAYAATHAARFQVLLDGEMGPEFDEISGRSMRFSPDGRRFSYLARQGTHWVLVLDGHVVEGYDDVPEPGVSFGPTGRAAYVGFLDKHPRVVIDGLPPANVEWVDPASIRWSADGAHVSYLTSASGLAIAVLDGTRLEPAGPGGIEPVELSADGAHWGFLRYKRSEGPDSLYVDGQFKAAFPKALAMRLSPDGQHWAVVEPRDRHYFAVVDGRPGTPFDEVYADMRFAPDGAHFVCRGTKGKLDQLTLDGVVVAEYESITAGALAPYFGPGGMHFTYKVAHRGHAFVVHDDARGPDYDAVLTNGPFVNSDGDAEYLAVRQGEVYAVLQKPGHR